MAMATVLLLLPPAGPSRELPRRKMTRSWIMSRTSTALGGSLKPPSPQFCSGRRRAALGVRILVVVRSSADAENDAETEHVQLLRLDGGDNVPPHVEFVGGPKTEIKSSLAKLVATTQLLGGLFALGMVIGVRVAAAAITGSPIDREKKSSVWSPWAISSSVVISDCSDQRDRELNAADSPEAEDQRIMHDIFFKGSVTDRGVAVAAEIDDGTDEEAGRDYDEWIATPYALTVPLRLVGLRGSVPPAWLKDFTSSQGKRVKVVAEFQGSLQNIFTELSAGIASQKQLTPKSVLAADLVTIGDSWLGKAVSRGLLTPIENIEKYEWFQRLGTNWQTFLRRNQFGDVDPNGKVYAVPYRWGSVVIAYNRKKFEQHGIPAIEDWDDLWRPELGGKIAMISSPRDVIGAVLKSLGASYNVNDLGTDVPGGRQAVKEKFHKLQQQVRVFDSVQYLKILGAGEVWVAVGWSSDVIPFAKRTSNISVITPRSGTSLWADLWGIPATPPSSTNVGGRVRGPSPLVHQWLDFCLQSARAKSFKGDVFVGASPLALSGNTSGENSSVLYTDRSVVQENDIVAETEEENPSTLSKDSDVLSPDPSERSEFLQPLSPAAFEDFKCLLSTNSEIHKFQLKSLANKFQNVFNK